MGYVEITQEQLAEVAGGVFIDTPVENIPNKMWMDYWPAGDQHYLRAIFDVDADVEVVGLIEEVGKRIYRRYDVPVVSVAYVGDYSWQDVEAWVMRLNAVQ